MRVAVLSLAILLAACQPWPALREPATAPPTAAPAPAAVAPAPTPIVLSDDPDAVRPAPIIDRGTGAVIGRPGARSRLSLTSDLEGEVTLNVVDADLREVVRLVLEDTLGVNYVIDPLVEGTITVQTSRPLPADDLIALLDGVLRLNGAALVRADDLYKVVPIEEALGAGLMPEVEPLDGEVGFTIRIVPLRFVSAAEIAEILAPFAPTGGSVQIDPDRNLLILAGSAEQIRTLSDLVQIFDVDWLEGMSFGLFPLQAAEAERLVGELDQIFGTAGEAAGAPEGVVRFVPIERLNAVLVISPEASYVSRAETWIERLDQGGEGDDPRVYVYAVQNGRASELAEVLSQLFDVQSTAVGLEDLLAPGLEPVDLRSSFDRGGALGTRDDRELDEPTVGGLTPPPLRSRVRPTGSASLPQDLTPIGADQQTRIIADGTTNSLVIRATPRDYQRIEAALQQLDILPLQVLIEATIAEVTLNDRLRFGLQYFFRFGSNEVRLSRADTGAVSSTFPGFSAIFSSSDQISVILDALEEVSDVNVVSSPQILVLDNQTAQLQVGDEVPIVTRQAQSIDDPDAAVLQNIEQRQTGVILTVTPRVNAGGLVIMEIEQEVSDVEMTDTSTIDSPTISQRRIASTVAIQSGEAVALGGLIRDNVENSRSGLPFLARLPIIGWLFGQTSDFAERTELLVLITPRVVRDPGQARSVTAELRQRLRGLERFDVRLR
ncbi:MAG: type II secretion system secretin GspD [Geminicoccaceae bacterium]|nr:type II secretion system secretin GspD [Geminicoccaceae bacterium]